MNPKYILVVLAALALTSCAFVYTQKADLNSAPFGIRVYPPKVYLAVDTTANISELIYAPDLQQAYDVNPITLFAKQNFQLDIEEGQVKTFKADQDTTAILDLIKSLTEAAAKPAGGAVSTKTIKGTFGLATGLYVLQQDGTFARLATPSSQEGQPPKR